MLTLPRKKIAVFQSDLNVGGIQKALLNLLNNLDPERFEVDLFVFSKGNFFKNDFGENIHIKQLPRSNIILKYVPYKIAKKFYTPPVDLDVKYDVAVDFNSFWHECAIGAQKVNADKRVMWLHSDITEKIRVEYRYRIAWWLGKSKFSGFDELVAVSQGVKDSFYKEAKKSDSDMKITVISNYVDTDEIFEKAKVDADFSVDCNKYNFVTVGRLAYEKGYDLLLDFFSQVVKQRQDVHLYFIGDGDEKEKLVSQADSLGISDFISFLGNQPNPFPYEKLMDGFVLTSRYEGQGIVIWEAKALGLSVFISKNLEKYNDGVTGYSDIVAAMCSAHKKIKVPDSLTDYNDNIRQSVNRLFGCESNSKCEAGGKIING